MKLFKVILVLSLILGCLFSVSCDDSKSNLSTEHSNINQSKQENNDNEEITNVEDTINEVTDDDAEEEPPVVEELTYADVFLTEEFENVLKDLDFEVIGYLDVPQSIMATYNKNVEKVQDYVIADDIFYYKVSINGLFFYYNPVTSQLFEIHNSGDNIYPVDKDGVVNVMGYREFTSSIMNDRTIILWKGNYDSSEFGDQVSKSSNVDVKENQLL